MKKVILFLTFFIMNIILTLSICAAGIVTDGLVSYWTFDRLDIRDGFAEDVWGENDAKIKGNPILVDGYLRNALYFDGVGDYVILKDTGNFGKQMGSSTFEVWLKTSEKRVLSAIYKTVERPCYRIDEGNGILINAYEFLPETPLHTKKDHIYIQFQTRDGKICRGSRDINTKFSISDGKWHHLVFVQGSGVRDTSNIEEAILYIDSVPIRRIRFNLRDLENETPYTQPVYLGAVNNNGRAESFFYGVFDEVRVYNRALSHEEVVQNFKSQIGLSVEPLGRLATVWGVLKKKP